MAREFDALVEQELRRRTGLVANPYDLPGYGSDAPPPRRGIQNIPDPSTDTFIERFRPLSSDPAGDYQKEQRFEMQRKMQEIEKGVPVYRPGTPRFGDPSKVTSQAGTGTATDALPPGWSRVEAPVNPPGLPPGWGPVQEKPAQQPAPASPGPSPLAGTQLSADPAEQAREVAALRLSRGQRPPEGRAETPSAGPGFVGGLQAGFNQFMRDAGGTLQEPQNAMAAALGGPVAPGIAAMRGGAALTRGLSEGGFRGVDQAAAGKAVSEGVAAGGATVTPRMSLLANEDSIGQMVGMARTGSPEDLTALARLRRVVPAERQAEVQGALVQRLGESPATGEFDAGKFISSYGKIGDRAKNILFGEGGQGSLRQHLDSIEEVTARAPTWRGPSGKTIATTVGLASAGGGLIGGTAGAIAAPLAVLGTMLPVKAVAMALTSPATAASVAAWSRAYERAVRSGGNAALVSFNIATRNLNNTLGVDINPQDALGGARGQPLE